MIASISFEDTGSRSKRGALRDTSVEGVAKEGMSLLMGLALGRPRARFGITSFGLTADGFAPRSGAAGAERGSLKRLFESAGAAASGTAAEADAEADAGGGGANQPPSRPPSNPASRPASHPASPHSGAPAAPAADWSCAVCTLINPADAARCTAGTFTYDGGHFYIRRDTCQVHDVRDPARRAPARREHPRGARRARRGRRRGSLRGRRRLEAGSRRAAQHERQLLDRRVLQARNIVADTIPAAGTKFCSTIALTRVNARNTIRVVCSPGPTSG